GPLGVPAFASIDQLPPRVRAVSVAVPTSLHHAVACPLLERGVHVLVEKPMAATLEEGRRMAALAADRGVILQVGHIERFNPALSVMDRLAVQPRFIQAERLAPFTYRALDVSVVMDLMIHDIDIVMDLAGAPLRDVQAVGSPVLGRRVDIASARLLFANGCVANLTASRVSFEPVRRLKVFGADTFVSMDFNTRKAFVVRKAPGFEMGSLAPEDAARVPPRASFKEFIAQGLLETQPIEMDEANPLQLELSAFVAAVRGGTAAGRPRVASAEEGLRAMEVAGRIGELIEGHRWADG
ncbi:MAG: Gfo/Idh/MocA family oxidoreductase, partial [Planctomycetes bacterium]|nr:Gfo/Idh/MocA family oxidoreductase [Planctomycetota bacterium]